MNKNFLFLLFALLAQHAVSQITNGNTGLSNPDPGGLENTTSAKGNWIVQLGWEGGLYFNEINTNLYGADSSYVDTAGAVFYPLSVEYCFTNRFSGGIAFRNGHYLTDQAGETNRTNVFDFLVSFHLLEKVRNDLHLRLAFGPAALRVERDVHPKFEGTWAGGHFGLQLGYRHYFGKHIGLYASLGRNGYSLNQKTLSAYDVAIDPDDARWDMSLSGWEFGFGLVGKF
ncbi:MAG: hypothetical protein RL220_1072 [Bacteroidota bacterium]